VEENLLDVKGFLEGDMIRIIEKDNLL